VCLAAFTLTIVRSTCFLIQAVLSGLENYIHQDAIASCLTEFSQALANVDSLSQARIAHDRFLETLTQRLFFSDRLVSNCLNQILECATGLRRVVSALSKGIPLAERSELIELISNETKRQFRVLTHTLAARSRLAKAPYAARLLLKIDFTGFTDVLNRAAMKN